MQDVNTQAIKAHYAKLSRYYGYQIDEYMIRAYAADLEDFDQRDVERALNHMRMDPARRRLPLPGEVRHFLRPKLSRDAEAQEIVSRIFANLGPVGRNNTEKAQAVLGPVAWEVVKRMGGWALLCNSDERDRNIQYAQAREQAKACLEASEIEHRALDHGRPLPEIEPSSKRADPLPIGDVLRSLGKGPDGKSHLGRPPIPALQHKRSHPLS